MLCRLQYLCVAVFPWEHSLAQGLQYCLVWAGEVVTEWAREVVTEWQWLQGLSWDGLCIPGIIGYSKG